MDFRIRRKRAPARPDLEQRFGDYTAWIGPNSPFALYQPSSSANFISDKPEQAIQGTIAVYAAVSLLSGIVGSLPLHLFEKTSTGRLRIEAKTAYQRMLGRGYPGTLARMLNESPNPEMTAQELWETVIGHNCLWGNAYLEVVRDPSGRPMELWPLRPGNMEVKRTGVNGEKVYKYTLETNEVNQTRKVVIFPADRIMHVKAFSSDGLLGLSPISVARLTIAGDQAATRFGNRFYENWAMPSAVVTIPPAPGKGVEGFKERAKAYREQIQNLYAGVSNAGRVAVMEQGIDWKTISMPMTDMQFVETRKFTVVEIARLFHIPPHMLGDVERSTSWGTGIEVQMLAFLALTLRPLLAKIENACIRDLGLVPGTKTLADEMIYPEFNTAELLRTDITQRYAAFAVGIDHGFLTRSDVRAFENMEPIEGLDEPLVSTNLQLADALDIQDTDAGATMPPPDPEANPNPSRDEAMHKETMAFIAAVANREQVAPNIEVHNTMDKPIQLNLDMEAFAVEMEKRLKPDIHITVPKQPVPEIHPEIVVNLPEPAKRKTKTTVHRDKAGNIKTTETEDL